MLVLWCLVYKRWVISAMFGFRRNTLASDAVGAKWDMLYDLLRASNAVAVVLLSFGVLVYLTSFSESGDTSLSATTVLSGILAVGLLAVSSLLLPIIIRTERLFDSAEVTGARESMVSRISLMDSLLFAFLNIGSGTSAIAAFVALTVPAGDAALAVDVLLALTGLSFLASTALAGFRTVLTRRHPVEASAYRQRAVGRGFRASLSAYTNRAD